MNPIRGFGLRTGRIFHIFKNCYAGTLFGRRFSSENAGDPVSISESNVQNDKTTSTSSLFEFVKAFERKASETLETQDNIPKTWTKANRKGGVSSILRNSRPQILGFTVQQMQERLTVLESIGVTGKDALLIAAELPSHLTFSSSSFKAIGDLLNSLGCNLAKLIIKAPYVFGVDSKELARNVQLLQNIGIPNEVIGQAIDSNPLIMVYPISHSASETIKLLLSSCEFDEGHVDDGHFSDFRQVEQHEFALRLLTQPFDGAREQAVLGDNFKQVAKFLHEIQVSPCLMVLNYPALFGADVEKLYQALEFFTGRPLLFETELIQKMMVTKSEVFLHFDRNVFEGRVELLKGILKTPRQLYLLLQKYFFFQGEEINLDHNIKILQKYKFQNEQIANILTAKDFFVSRETDLEAKVKFLFSIEGITVDLIADYSFCLLKPIIFLENRIKFAREAKPEILIDLNMEILFGTDDEEFITLVCESTIEKYQELTGEVISTKKTTLSQQRKKKKMLPEKLRN
jgi:hypothetical protein